MALTLGRTRVRAHPLALMYPAMAAMLGGRSDAVALLMGLAVHEGAHLLAARGLGVGVSQLRLMPFGGAITLENPYALSPARLLAVAAAGPLGNGLALFVGAALAHWRLISPALALALLRVNLVLLVFNLLPALPLDGGRMLYALLFPTLGRDLAASVGIWAGRIVAGLLLALALASLLAVGRFNLPCAVAAVFLLASGPDERRALSEVRARTMLSELRPILRPVPARIWGVGGDCRVRDALRAARPDALTLYAVYKDSRLASVTDDRRLLEAALKEGLEATLGEVLG